MNVASLEVSKELYELSGWKVDRWFYDTSYNPTWLRDISNLDHEQDREWKGIQTIPAYDLGYLLRKLIDYMPSVEYSELNGHEGRGHGAEWRAFSLIANVTYADNPEDAVAMLAIQLFKQGILTREGEVKTRTFAQADIEGHGSDLWPEKVLTKKPQ